MVSIAVALALRVSIVLPSTVDHMDLVWRVRMRIVNAPAVGPATDVTLLLPILATIGYVPMVVLARLLPLRLPNAYVGEHGLGLIAISFLHQLARMVLRIRTKQAWIVGVLAEPVMLLNGCKEFGRIALVRAAVERELVVLPARTLPIMCVPALIVL